MVFTTDECTRALSYRGIFTKTISQCVYSIVYLVDCKNVYVSFTNLSFFIRGEQFTPEMLCYITLQSVNLVIINYDDTTMNTYTQK